MTGDPRSAIVIGYGNTLRRDDGAGPVVAEAVAAWNVAGVTAWSVHQLAPELAEAVAQADLAVFVDARASSRGGEAVERRVVSPDPAAAGTLGHVSDPGVLLYLAEALYGRRPAEAWLITVPAVDLEHGEGLSPAGQEGVRAALAEVARLLGRTVPDA